jgi:hypothetical protein
MGGRRSLGAFTAALLAACILPSHVAAQQSMPAYGRISINFMTGGATDLVNGGPAVTFQQVISSFTYRTPEPKNEGAEFAFDARGANYPGGVRQNRMSIYDGYVGIRLDGGHVLVRGGQMWITDLGGLGSVAGGLIEVRRQSSPGAVRIRFGAFTGLEPSTLDIDYAPGVRKFGGYVAFDGSGARRQVIGYVNVQDHGLTERSVLTFTNYLPVAHKLFLYQAGEYDLTGVAGNGGGHLSYFLTNASAYLSPRVELQGTYHRCRSIDARSLALDVLQGTPIATSRVEGLFYESIGSRVWVTVMPHVRVNAGYSHDRTNSQDAQTNRYQLGANAWNLHGFDFYITRSLISATSHSYSAWDASLGRNVGSRIYLTGDYSTNLSSIRLIDDRGIFTIDHRPRTKRYGVSALSHLTRHFSLLSTVDQTDDGQIRDQRFLLGVTIRF